MSLRTSVVSAFVSLMLATCLPGQSPTGAQAARGRRSSVHLDARIGKAHARWYRHTTGAWDNPEVIIDRTGISLRAAGSSPRMLGTDVDDLVSAMTALPVAAWPHGRVVRVVQTGRVGVALASQSEPTDAGYMLLKRTREAMRRLNVVIVDGPVG